MEPCGVRAKGKFSAVILAGGESKRMGRDKAWLELDGKPLVVRAVDHARRAGAQEVFVSGRAGVEYRGVSCPVLIDLNHGLGPLSGIERGLQVCSSPLLLILAADLPRMTAEFILTLLGRCDEQTGIVPQLNGELEPLAAFYPKRTYALAARMLAQSRRAARSFAEACIQEGAASRFALSETEAALLFNCNTPADLRLGGLDNNQLR